MGFLFPVSGGAEGLKKWCASHLLGGEHPVLTRCAPRTRGARTTFSGLHRLLFQSIAKNGRAVDEPNIRGLEVMKTAPGSIRIVPGASSFVYYFVFVL